MNGAVDSLEPLILRPTFLSGLCKTDRKEYDTVCVYYIDQAQIVATRKNYHYVGTHLTVEREWELLADRYEIGLTGSGTMTG